MSDDATPSIRRGRSTRERAGRWRAGVVGLLLVAAAVGQAPPGYYATVDPSDAQALRRTLHAVVDDHVRYAVDIGTSQPPTTRAGSSLQCAGIGNTGPSFRFEPPHRASPGRVNPYQTLR